MRVLMFFVKMFFFLFAIYLFLVIYLFGMSDPIPL